VLQKRALIIALSVATPTPTPTLYQKDAFLERDADARY
jgi:hypothetical protein